MRNIASKEHVPNDDGKRHIAHLYPGWIAVYEKGKLVACGHQDFLHGLSDLAFGPLIEIPEMEKAS